MSSPKKIQVVIVDDSAVVRQTLSHILNSDPDIEVVSVAQDPYIAVEKIRKHAPDVLTLDVEMPRMDGITFLEKIMRQHPIPVVMCSSLTEAGGELYMRAIELGAVEVITKPQVGVKESLMDDSVRICDAIHAAARAKSKGKKEYRKPSRAASEPRQSTEKLSADAVLPATRPKHLRTTEKVFVIGASTGGTEALKVLLETFPRDCPGTVVVQHMPENFTAAFAKRLDGLSAVNIKEAENGDAVLPGHVYIAPGNKHTLLRRSGARYYLDVQEGPLVSRHRPSVDVLFRSAAQNAGPNCIASILTGMGDDGATGMKELQDSGAYTIAQDEASCVVYGMPAEAVARGGVSKILPLNDITSAMIDAAKAASPAA
ncbi:MAG: protein-glutamate methylesterase/protein-glutamine glutaminase [Opitutales bacterium]